MAGDKNIYKKVGRRYIPIGVCEPVKWLSDGIWLVKSNQSGQQRTNLKFLSEIYGYAKLGEIPVADFTMIAKMEQYESAVAKVLLKHKAQPVGICIADMAREIIQAMYNINEQQK